MNQFSFKVGSLADLRTYYEAFVVDGIEGIDPVDHGNAWSVYFRDPEGNQLEVFTDTPWSVKQPRREVLDFSLSDEEIHEATLARFGDDEGNITEVQAVRRDINERMPADIALHDPEQRLRDAIENLQEGMALYDSDERLLFCNRKYQTRFGAAGDYTVPGATFEDVVRARIEHGSFPDLAEGKEEQWIEERLQQFREHSGLVEFPAGQGWLQVRNERLPDGGTIVLDLDITEHKERDVKLRESEQRYRMLVEASPDAILIARKDGIIVFANSTAVDLFGADSVDRLIGMDMLETVHPDDRADIAARRQQILQGTQLPFAQRRRRRLDGSYFYTETRLFLFTWEGDAAFLVVIRDITERRETEEQLRQALKMEAVGQLTGGMAHDFNNLLLVVLGNLELAKDNLGDDSDVSALIDRASVAAERGATLIHRLLAFSRKQALMPGIIDLNELVAGMTDLLRRTLGEIIEIETVSADDLWPCAADSSQIENALLNLAVNARDAMPDGGKLTIETGNVDLDDEYASAQADVTPGNYVMVAVTDTGAGMPRRVIDHAFEPFFTTKEAGKGSGLGLSMIYGLVKQSGGHVTIYSEEGVGTTVKMYLPKSLAGTEEKRHVERETVPRARGETILVVEDDADVRTLTVALLRDLGYEILEAADGDSALAALDKASRVDLLFSDVVLPGGMSGPKLANEVKSRVPGISVLYTSGYTDNSIVHQGRIDKGVQLLNKPFRKATLAQTVRSVLDKADS